MPVRRSSVAPASANNGGKEQDKAPLACNTACISLVLVLAAVAWQLSGGWGSTGQRALGTASRWEQPLLQGRSRDINIHREWYGPSRQSAAWPLFIFRLRRQRLVSITEASCPAPRCKPSAPLPDLLLLAAASQAATTKLSLSSFACGYAPERTLRLLRTSPRDGGAQVHVAEKKTSLAIALRLCPCEAAPQRSSRGRLPSPHAYVRVSQLYPSRGGCIGTV